MKLSWANFAYICLGIFLFVSTFGSKALFIVFLASVFFFFGVLLALFSHGSERAEELLGEFNGIQLRSSTGISRFLQASDTKRRRGQSDRLTGSGQLDPIVEEIISYALRDYVESWYGALSNDELLLDSLRLSSHQTVAVLSTCLRKVDWVPLLTEEIVDDFASHIRLYRKAKEKKDKDADLETLFFDLELDMEKSYCRDLVSTSSQYENAYLHDLADILLYLLIPPEDFRSRPIRFLFRELLVGKILLPLIDQLSDPDYINATIVWLLNEMPLASDDFLCVVEASECAEELVAVRDCLDEEIEVQRARDTGGDDDTLVKQQLGSLYFVRKVVDMQLRRIGSGADSIDAVLENGRIPEEASKLCDLPLSFILTNNISVSYFIDYLASVGGQVTIDLFLAIEGYKVSVEHQLASAHLNRVTRGEKMDPEVAETIREAAMALYKQYLADDAAERVAMDVELLRNLIHAVKNEQPSESWFDAVQTKLMEALDRDPRFYPSFRRNPLFFRMLADLALINRDGSRVDDIDVGQCEEAMDVVSLKSNGSGGSAESHEARMSFLSSEEEPSTTAHITTIGIGRENNHAFALYNIHITRENVKGESISSWNILRRYSDFHTLHSLIEAKFPNLASLGFPAKKTFNNLNQDFLDKRKRALNTYLRTLLHPEVVKQNKGLEEMVMDFLCQKDYAPNKGVLSRKVLSLVRPIRSGVRAFGFAVTSVPDTLADGMSRMGDGIGKVTKSVLGEQAEASAILRTNFLSTFLPDRWIENPLLSPLWRSSRQAEHLYRLRVGVGSGDVEGRVAAGLGADVAADNIPLRILLLLTDEVFGLRQRNQWFRRRLIAFLRQFIHAAFGTSINRKIVDFVVWLTSEDQVAEYLGTFRNSFWSNGVLAESSPVRPHHIQMRTRVVAKTKMLAALPDELRLFLGSETSRSGVELVFEALQNPHLNRRLVYVLLERLLVTVFPDNRFQQILPRLHSKSPRCQAGK